MTRSEYSFGIFLMVLTVITGFLHAVAYLVIGGQVFYLDVYPYYFFLSNLIYFAGTAILIKYFYRENYKAAFYTLLLTALLTLVQMIVLYNMISNRHLSSLYFAVVIFLLCSSMVFGATLIFSNASLRKWFKPAGILILITSALLLAISLFALTIKESATLWMLEQASRWISLSTTLTPIFFVLIFKEELKATDNIVFKKEDKQYAIFKFLLLVAFLASGYIFLRDSYMSHYWYEKNQEKTAQMIEMSDQKTFIGSQGDSLSYLLINPVQFDSSKQYPLVISLPYAGYEASAAQVLSENVNRLKYPAYIMVPYCPEGEGWGGVPNTPVIDQLVFEAIESLDATENIDINRRYITGVSRGGYGTWHFITERPDLFAAAIPVCGEGNPSLAPEITDVAVWAFHGEKDKNVPVSGSRDMIEAMEEAGKSPKYTEYQNEGHNIWYQVSTEPELWTWLFSQRKGM
ncbi:carboxylesterase family protein [Algoriphagus chordae]|uniref:Prolyl oligopeptidase family protein n=1 Tax=Algoriphagus chordae TaxID=237019 RepID=A0A2W7R212_9BACT|nr:prolyl oligopeptidase family serine peptidase [Algoriphagus chordae]PZX54873.1 prolyl oligopeptidase family protein [Algoriphagus chordae]